MSLQPQLKNPSIKPLYRMREPVDVPGGDGEVGGDRAEALVVVAEGGVARFVKRFRNPGRGQEGKRHLLVRVAVRVRDMLDQRTPVGDTKKLGAPTNAQDRKAEGLRRLGFVSSSPLVGFHCLGESGKGLFVEDSSINWLVVELRVHVFSAGDNESDRLRGEFSRGLFGHGEVEIDSHNPTHLYKIVVFRGNQVRLEGLRGRGAEVLRGRGAEGLRGWEMPVWDHYEYGKAEGLSGSLLEDP